jgi:hypothetical protein
MHQLSQPALHIARGFSTLARAHVRRPTRMRRTTLVESRAPHVGQLMRAASAHSQGWRRQAQSSRASASSSSQRRSSARISDCRCVRSARTCCTSASPCAHCRMRWVQPRARQRQCLQPQARHTRCASANTRRSARLVARRSRARRRTRCCGAACIVPQCALARARIGVGARLAAESKRRDLLCHRQHVRWVRRQLLRTRSSARCSSRRADMLRGANTARAPAVVTPAGRARRPSRSAFSRPQGPTDTGHTSSVRGRGLPYLVLLKGAAACGVPPGAVPAK